MPFDSSLLVKQPPEDYLICAICLDCLDAPEYAFGVCDHVFCSICIRDHLSRNWKKSVPCPVCNKGPITAEKLQSNRILKEILLKLDVQCDGEGCDEIMTLQDYKQHKDFCATERVACESAECKIHLLRRDRKRHRCITYWKGEERAAKAQCLEKDKTIATLQTTLEEKEEYIKHLEKTYNLVEPEVLPGSSDGSNSANSAVRVRPLNDILMSQPCPTSHIARPGEPPHHVLAFNCVFCKTYFGYKTEKPLQNLVRL